MPQHQQQQQGPPSSALSNGSGLDLHTGELNNILAASNMYYPLPDYGMAYNQGSPPVYYPGTISPSQLPHQMLKPTKSFSDLLLESRQSSLSASSTEHEWNATDDPLSVPLARALVMDQNKQQQQRQQQQQQFQNNGSSHLGLDVKPPLDMNPLVDPTRGQVVSQALRQYMMAQNRLAFGERKIIIMSPKVGQKSYGSEKRFLCPHPQATLIGQAWFSQSQDECPVSPLLPPRVNISLSGEAPAKDGHVAWTTLDNKSLDDKIHTQAITDKDRPFLGNVAGKNLHISDSDSKRREVKALVTVKAPFAHHAGANGWGPSKNTMWDISNERIIGVFESKEIKVISKPSKKKSNSKSAERKLLELEPLLTSSDCSTRINNCTVQSSQVSDVVYALPLCTHRPHEATGLRWQASYGRCPSVRPRIWKHLPRLYGQPKRMGVLHHLPCRPDQAWRCG